MADLIEVLGLIHQHIQQTAPGDSMPPCLTPARTVKGYDKAEHICYILKTNYKIWQQSCLGDVCLRVTVKVQNDQHDQML